MVIYAIPSEKRCCWSNDLLGADVLDREQSKQLTVEDRTGVCRFDIRALGSEIRWDFRNINLCRSGKEMEIILRDHASTGDKNRTMLLTNDSALAARGVYAIPSKRSCCWSPNLLYDKSVRFPRTISAGESRDIDFDIGANACLLDVRVSSTTPGVGWNFDEIDVCNGLERTLTLQK